MDKPDFKKIVIAGVGLMGGSLGLAVKRAGLAEQVVGFARRPQTIRQAKTKGCIDLGTLSPAVAGKDADLVVLCGPVSVTPGQLKELMPHLPPHCLVTDVGSTKTELLRQIEQLIFTANFAKRPGGAQRLAFVGSHPMAGSEKAGVLSAHADLYQKALCILVKTPRTPVEVLNRLEKFWRAVGCDRILVMTPQEHDRLTAVVSHLPHALAVTMVNLLLDLLKQDARLTDIAAGGFRDTTRIAASEPKMWSDIFISNREEVCRFLELYTAKLTMLKNHIERAARTPLVRELERASAFRTQMEKKPHDSKKN